jgi:hypothetical protein
MLEWHRVDGHGIDAVPRRGRGRRGPEAVRLGQGSQGLVIGVAVGRRGPLARLRTRGQPINHRLVAVVQVELVQERLAVRSLGLALQDLDGVVARPGGAAYLDQAELPARRGWPAPYCPGRLHDEGRQARGRTSGRHLLVAALALLLHHFGVHVLQRFSRRNATCSFRLALQFGKRSSSFYLPSLLQFPFISPSYAKSSASTPLISISERFTRGAKSTLSTLKATIFSLLNYSQEI